MAEIQPTTNSSDLTQRFVYFVQMQMQNVMLCLGLIDHPSAPKGEPDLPAARMFIDQLEMIREKTRNNLTKEEEKFLTGVLSELQMAFVQVSSGAPGHVHDESCRHDHDHGTTASASAGAPEPSASPASAVQAEAPKSETPKEDDVEGKKKFTKSYGS